ncbi:hypothetical protein N9948_00685 [bacterium]|nr:hypothetical protein [bacterium]
MKKELIPHGFMQKDLEKKPSEDFDGDDERSFEIDERDINFNTSPLEFKFNPNLKDKIKDKMQHMMLQRRKKIMSSDSVKDKVREVLAKKKPSKRPPKEWFYKVLAEVRKNSPELSEEQARAVVGDMWYNEMNAKSKKRVKKEESDKKAMIVKKALLKLKNKEAKFKMLDKIKKMLPPKKYTTLNEENALALAKDDSSKNYWKFKIPEDAEVKKVKHGGDAHIDIEIESDELKDYKWFTVWYDPNLKRLVGNYKPHVGVGQGAKELGKFTPLTEKNAIEYARLIDSDWFTVPEKPKTQKKKDGEVDFIEIEVLDKKNKDIFTFDVWYDPFQKGLYGEG